MKIYKPQREPFAIKHLQPGNVCKIERYPFYWIAGDKFDLFCAASYRAISNFETTIYDISGDTFTFLKKVDVPLEDSVWTFCKFLVDEQIVYVSGYIIIDSTVTVLI